MNIILSLEELLENTSVGILAAKIAEELAYKQVIVQNGTKNNTEVSCFTSELLTSQQVADIPPPRGFFTRVVLNIFGFISRLIWKFEVIGIENVPATGSFILCPNHESHFDGLWIISCLPPSLKYQFCTLAKKEHFETSFNRFFASLMGAIPVDRQGDALPALCAATKAY